MLDGAQGVLVHGIAVIKIPHDQRIDAAKFRQYFSQKRKTLQGSKRDTGIIGAQNLAQDRPSHLRISYRQLWMLHDVGDAALGAPAQGNSHASGIGEEREEDRAVGKLFDV